MPLLPQRRGKDIFSTLESGRVHVFEGKIQILRARLRINGKAAVAGFTHLFESLIATQMDDVNWGSGHFGEGNRSRDSFRFRRRWTSQGVILRSLFSFRQRLLHDHVNRAAVFGMHADESAVL